MKAGVFVGAFQNVDGPTMTLVICTSRSKWHAAGMTQLAKEHSIAAIPRLFCQVGRLSYLGNRGDREMSIKSLMAAGYGR